MMNFGLKLSTGEPLTLLCIGAHSDDIEIGCGGTILRILRDSPKSVVHWIVFSAAGIRKEEAHRGWELFTGATTQGIPTFHGFQDGFLPFQGAEVKRVFEELKHGVNPDIVLTHNRKDGHQDHRLLAELAWNTFRDHLILEYEIPKYDGDLGQPNVFVPLERELCDKKVEHLLNAFPSQHSKHWFEPEMFRSLMRLRGMECNAPSGYAEAFYCRKLVF
jgi:LmbE family N-acetylglucosaminyl deacetylase